MSAITDYAQFIIASEIMSEPAPKEKGSQKTLERRRLRKKKDRKKGRTR